MRVPVPLILRRLVLVVALVTAGGTAHAQSRLFVGARNLAMGGTGVGSSDDAVSVHYNPAGMAFANSWEVQLPLVAMDVELDGDSLENIDELLTLFEAESLREIQDHLNDGTATPEEIETALEAFLDVLPDLDTTEDAAVVRAALGPAFRWKNWGVSAFYSGSGGADTLVDLGTGLSLSSAGLSGAIPDPVPANSCGRDPVCLGFADDLVQETGIDRPRAEVLVVLSGDNLSEEPRAFDILTDIVNATVPGNPTLADNPSEIRSTGILIGQAAFTYSSLIYRDKLSVGASAKILSGRTFTSGTRVADLDGDDDFDTLFEQDNTRTDIELGLDLGVMYRPTSRWSFGFMASNVNSPAFDLAGIRGAIELEPQFRAGAAYRPLRWFNLALDADLNEVDSGLVRGLGYRYANFGAEFLLGRWFAGRVGAYRNLSTDRASTIYTGGVSFGVKRFSVELALGAAADRTSFNSYADGRSIPKGFAASLQFNWRPRPAQQGS